LSSCTQSAKQATPDKPLLNLAHDQPHGATPLCGQCLAKVLLLRACAARAHAVQVAELTAHVIDRAVQMCQELPRPLSFKTLAMKFMEPHEQVLQRLGL